MTKFGFYLPTAGRKILFFLGARCTNNFRERTFGSRRFQKPVPGKRKKAHSIFPFTYANYYTNSILPSTYWGVTRSCPSMATNYARYGHVSSWPQIMQIRILFRSRSGLVLDSDHSLNAKQRGKMYARERERKTDRKTEGGRPGQRGRGKKRHDHDAQAAPLLPRRRSPGAKTTRREEETPGSAPRERRRGEEREEKRKRERRGGKTKTQNSTVFSPPKITKTPPRNRKLSPRNLTNSMSELAPQNRTKTTPIKRENSKNRG